MIRNFLGSPRHLAIRGVAAIVFGIATLIWPDVTLWALVVLWGAYALVDGSIALASAISDKYLLNRGRIALAGISGIVAGVLTFVWPEITALALLYVIAAWSLVNGFTLIGIAVSERKRLTGEWVIAAGRSPVGAPRPRAAHQPWRRSAGDHLGDRLVGLSVRRGLPVAGVDGPARAQR